MVLFPLDLHWFPQQLKFRMFQPNNPQSVLGKNYKPIWRNGTVHRTVLFQQSGGHLGFEGSPEQEYEQGFPPKGVAKHGPQFLSLTREEKGWLKRVHHRMGHPDPIRFAKFPKETHADPHVVARRFSV